MNIASPEAFPSDVERIDANEKAYEQASSAVFQRILVPIDFSHASRAALRFALDVRKRFGGSLLLMNVAGPTDGDDFLGGLGAPWNAGDIQDDATAQLGRFVAHVAPLEDAPAVMLDVELRGDIAGAVREAVMKCDATLVVLSKTLRSRRPLLRTRTERIASVLSCAVMIVPCEPEPEVARD